MANNGFDVHMMVDGISTINSCQKNNRLNENAFKKHTVGQKIRPGNGVYNYLQINNRLVENELKCIPFDKNGFDVHI